MRYMDALIPFLVECIESHSDPSLVIVAVGAMGDITRALGKTVLPYHERFMQILFASLTSGNSPREAQTAILSTISDIALAVGAPFAQYLPQVLEVLGQAALVQAEDVISILLFNNFSSWIMN